MFLSRISVRRPVLMTMIIGMFVVFGVVAYQNMPVQLLPGVELPYVMVTVVYPGAGPEDIETAVLMPLEQELGKVNNVKTIRTTAVPDAGFAILELEMGTDPEDTESNIRALLEQIDSQLPPSAHQPQVRAIDLGAAPVMALALTSDLPPTEMGEWVEDHLEVPLSRVDGVATVESVGRREREVQVEVNQEQLLGHHLTLGHVVEAVRSGGIDLPAGIVEGENLSIPVRLEGSYDSIADLEAVIIEAPTGELVPLDAVAQIRDGISPESTRARINGESCIGLSVYKMADSNTVAMGQRLRTKLASIEADLEPGMKLVTIYDASTSIQSSVNSLVLTMGLCILLTALLLYLFLHDLRGTLIVAITIPASIIASMTFIYLAGFSINYMTLMGLAITVGTLVDASIVVLESITRQVKEDPAHPAAAADRGTARVVLGVIGSTATNIAVFTPIAFMKGIAAQFFTQFAFTIVFSMIFSLFMSFTLTPMLASLLYRRKQLITFRGPLVRLWDRGMTALMGRYTRVLRWTLHNRLATLLALLTMFVATLVFIGRTVSQGWFVSPDQGFFVLQLDMPRGTSLADTEQAMERTEQILSEHGAIETYYGTVGQYSTLFGPIDARNMAEMRVVLADVKGRPRTARVIEELRPELARRVPGASYTLKELGGGETAIRDDFMIEITGPDPEVQAQLASRVDEALEAQPNVVDIEIEGAEMAPEIRVIPDPVRTAQAGLTKTQLALLLRVAIEGDTEARMRRERDEDPIRVRLREQDRADLNSVAATTVQTPSGAQVPLRELARVVEVEAASNITRMDRYRRVTIFANLGWGGTEETTAALNEALPPESLPPMYQVRLGGEEEQRAEAQGEILGALLLAMLLTYMLLAGLLESTVHPFSILSTIPLALIGVLIALAVSGVALDIFGMMALVMLIGIVVNNAILMLEETGRQRREGLHINDALEKGALLRLRPILMTSLSTIAGMIPLAMALGEGAELRQSMALVSIGGVGTSSVLILVACPVFYHFIEDIKARLKGQRLDWVAPAPDDDDPPPPPPQEKSSDD